MIIPDRDPASRKYISKNIIKWLKEKDKQNEDEIYIKQLKKSLLKNRIENNIINLGIIDENILQKLVAF